ncbi:MAG TPA: S8 family serine peptidase [Pyrinomonadaceae bacterium]|nr:S8 family serine peptidase [Pyrinomonadaceae bacterium]
MLITHFGRNQRRFRLALTLLLFSSALAIAFIALPPRSGAKPPAQETQAQGKRTKAGFVPGEVLVRYRNEGEAKAKGAAVTLARADGQTLPIQIERLRGADLVPGLRLAHVAAEDTMSALQALKKQPDVLYAEPNYIWHVDATPNDPRFLSNELYGLTKIGGPLAWDTTTGSASVVIGVVDEGIDLVHPDLIDNIWTNPMPGSITGINGDLHGYNFVDNTGTIPGEDHATHVAGTAGARGNNGVGVVGVNWTVSLMSLRALDPLGGDVSDIVDAYTYAKQMRDLWVSTGGTKGANIRVLNNSYGGSGFSQTAFDAITALNQSGILFVGSAGNTDDGNTNNDATPHYPSDYNVPNTISVGATNQTDLMASFSHIGPNSVTLGAPGQSILSTLPGNAYGIFSGTSMSSPHVSGSAALICAANPNVTLQQLRALLIFNGDIAPDLVSKTITGRRLNVANSLAALAENDSTPPGTVTNFHINSQNGRSLNLGWNASGDNGASGNASLYELSFLDAKTGAVVSLKKVIPVASGSAQTADVKIPFRHTAGTIRLREFDNVGNEGTPASLNVSVSFAEGDPYATTLSIPTALSTGGTLLSSTNCDDCYRITSLPFAFPFFGQAYNSVTISSNGNLYFEPPSPPVRSGGDADDVPSSSVDLTRFKMIAGLWDDIDLRTSSRADAGVFQVLPDASRVIFRWQGVPCNFNGSVCTGGAPINFEIELRNDGTIKSRYGSGNTGLFPVVGIAGGEPDAYLIPTHTSEDAPMDLTNAVEVTYIPRNVINPLDNNFFFISQQYRDLLNREPDLGGLDFWSSDLNSCGTNQMCLVRRRVAISAAFFIELEFQRTGSFVVRSFKGGLGRQPNYAEFTTDRPQIVEGPNLEQTKQTYMLAFVQRPEFINKYAGANTDASFVDALLANINLHSGVDLSAQRQALINKYNTGSGMAQSRAFATRDAIDATAFQDAEYNRAFVLMQYFGYLARDIDQGGYDFWLDVLNNRVPGNFQGMVCAFITSAEYQHRFSTLAPHSDQECGAPNF